MYRVSCRWRRVNHRADRDPSGDGEWDDVGPAEVGPGGTEAATGPSGLPPGAHTEGRIGDGAEVVPTA